MVGRGVRFSDFMDAALYEPHTGFYATRGAAGRRSDFLTSPEVGPLFGALVARRLDQVWEEIGRPDPFAVVEVGAGPGTLARTVAIARPDCSPALRYLQVEVSERQRSAHGEHLDGWVGELDASEVRAFIEGGGPGPRFASSSSMPSVVRGVVLANELLDNLPFDIVRRGSGPTSQLLEVHEVDGERTFVPVDVDLPVEMRALLDSLPADVWVPWQQRARSWITDALSRLAQGRVVVVDYGEPTAALAGREPFGWLRTYAGHERGDHPLEHVGAQDITADVAIDQLTLDNPAQVCTTQREWLLALGIEELVEEGRRVWRERAAAPDLVALRARSRVGEAEALLDPEGLGGFVVLEWSVAGT